MLLYGNDFAFKTTRNGYSEVIEFKIIDNLIKFLNNYSQSILGFQVNARYATPTEYFESILKYKD